MAALGLQLPQTRNYNILAVHVQGFDVLIDTFSPGAYWAEEEVPTIFFFFQEHNRNIQEPM